MDVWCSTIGQIRPCDLGESARPRDADWAQHPVIATARNIQ